MGVMKGLAAVAVLAVVAAAVLVFAGCDGQADADPTPEPTSTPTAISPTVTSTPEPTATPMFTPDPRSAVTLTQTPAPEHLVTLIVVSDGSHDSLLLEWSGGPPNPTKWQYRRGAWRRDPGCWERDDGASCRVGQADWRRDPSCWERDADVSCWERDEDLWRTDFGAWTDIPGSGASTRSFRDTGLPPRSNWTYEVRAVVGTVAAPGNEYGWGWGGTQEQGRQPLDFYASDIVEGDGQRRWLVLDFTIVIPDGVRVTTFSSPYQELAGQFEGQLTASLTVYEADSGVDDISYGDDAGTLRFGPNGEVRSRHVYPPRKAPALDQIIASIRPHTP